jgi:hypothetical protein
MIDKCPNSIDNLSKQQEPLPMVLLRLLYDHDHPSCSKRH